MCQGGGGKGEVKLLRACHGGREGEKGESRALNFTLGMPPSFLDERESASLGNERRVHTREKCVMAHRTQGGGGGEREGGGGGRGGTL